MVDIYEKGEGHGPDVDDGSGEAVALGIGFVLLATVAGVGFAFRRELMDAMGSPARCHCGQKAPHQHRQDREAERVSPAYLRLMQLPPREMEAERIRNAPKIPTLAEWRMNPAKVKADLAALDAVNLPNYIKTPQGTMTLEEVMRHYPPLPQTYVGENVRELPAPRQQPRMPPARTFGGRASTLMMDTFDELRAKKSRDEAALRVRQQDVARNAQPAALAAYWEKQRNAKGAGR